VAEERMRKNKLASKRTLRNGNFGARIIAEVKYWAITSIRIL